MCNCLAGLSILPSSTISGLLMGHAKRESRPKEIAPPTCAGQTVYLGLLINGDPQRQRVRVTNRQVILTATDGPGTGLLRAKSLFVVRQLHGLVLLVHVDAPQAHGCQAYGGGQRRDQNGRLVGSGVKPRVSACGLVLYRGANLWPGVEQQWQLQGPTMAGHDQSLAAPMHPSGSRPYPTTA